MNTKKYYLIYQITNNINGKIYIGQHQTYDINDGYMGSGVHLQRSIQKYGIENFSKTILFQCSSLEEMNQKEAELVNEEFVKRDDTYNVIVGGSNGSWQKIHDAGLHKLGGVNAIKKHGSPWFSFWNSLSDEEKVQWKQNHVNTIYRLANWSKEHPEHFIGENNPMYGHVYTEETLRKMSENHKGKKNSQFGTMWICNDLTKENRKIKKTDPIPKGWRKGRIY